MYDIVKMMDKPFAMEAMHNVQLYEDIVAHRKKFTAWSGLDYTTHLPHTISFLPPESIEAVFRNDYKQMSNWFLFSVAAFFSEIMWQFPLFHGGIRDIEKEKYRCGYGWNKC